MSVRLIIAEKPSVAGHIARAFNCVKSNGYSEGLDFIVTWAYGHLVTLLEPQDYDAKYANWDLSDYPITPDPFKYKTIQNTRKTKYKSNTPAQQLALIQSLAQRPDVDAIIIATDWDREGQVIGDSILANITYPRKPVYRLLLNEWTESAIKQGMSSLVKNSQMKDLSDAGFCRQHMDWLIGMNFTVGMTKTRGKGLLFNVGRVLLPTLKIIYDRYIEQKTFVPVKYSELYVELKGYPHPIKYSGLGLDKQLSHKELSNLLNRLKKSSYLEVTEVIDTVEEEYPKLLFNLTALQAHITSKFTGWTSDKVLSVCQSLYEKQLITYPRTESCYLDESVIGKTKAVVSSIIKSNLDDSVKSLITFKGGKAIFNSARVSSHGAIVPTIKNIGETEVSQDEILVYMEVFKRFISKFMPNAKYGVRTIKGKINNIELEVVDRVLTDKGWVLAYDRGTLSKNSSILSNYKVGDMIPIEKVYVEHKVTTPPNNLTESAVLKIMETCGKDSNSASVLQGYSIGTPATRAETLKKLKSAKYITQSGKFLNITDKGKYLIENFPVKDLLDLDFTGRIEALLKEVEEGKRSKIQLDEDIVQFVEDGTQLMKVIGTRNVIGTCPKCGGYIIDGPTGYGCSNYNLKCNTVLLNKDLEKVFGVEPFNELMTELFNSGWVELQYEDGSIRTFKSKVDPDVIIEEVSVSNQIQSF